MRTGAEYREALRDGRKVWVMGDGPVADVTTHPATRAMVEEYAAWYDRHFDPAWQEILLASPDAGGERRPWAYVAPKSVADLIALGILTAAQTLGVSQHSIAAAQAYREAIASSGRFLTYCGGAPIIGQRLHPDPAQRVALKLVRETDSGILVRGRLGMHTSPAYAEDVYVGSLSGLDIGGQRASFIVPVGAAGVSVLCRRIATRDQNPFLAPLSHRYDELDGQMWLEDVFVPWERVFFVDTAPEAIPRWLRWHHLYGWLAKAEFTLGLALALSDAMGLKHHEPTVEYLVDLIETVQMVRTSLTAAERDPEFTAAGYCFPAHARRGELGIALG